MDTEARLKQSWDENAESWITSVRGGHIPSRQLGTDGAIVEIVRALSPRSVLDMGCGEGWLVRALAAQGIEGTGMDGSAALIEAARHENIGVFRHLSYEALVADPVQVGGPFDAIVCNFALLGEVLAPLLTALRVLTLPGGHLVVQTAHPLSGGDAAYAAGWREESFSAFGVAYPSPMPWFFRPFGNWVSLLTETGWTLTHAHEPLHPHTQRPLSLLLVARNPA